MRGFGHDSRKRNISLVSKSSLDIDLLYLITSLCFSPFPVRFAFETGGMFT